MVDNVLQRGGWGRTCGSKDCRVRVGRPRVHKGKCRVLGWMFMGNRWTIMDARIMVSGGWAVFGWIPAGWRGFRYEQGTVETKCGVGEEYVYACTVQQERRWWRRK